MEKTFSVRYVKELYNEDWQFGKRNPRVEAGSNTSTVALGVAGGDEKGIQCLGA
jgi:hypothetical protein